MSTARPAGHESHVRDGPLICSHLARSVSATPVPSALRALNSRGRQIFCQCHSELTLCHPATPLLPLLPSLDVHPPARPSLADCLSPSLPSQLARPSFSDYRLASPRVSATRTSPRLHACLPASGCPSVSSVLNPLHFHPLWPASGSGSGRPRY